MAESWPVTIPRDNANDDYVILLRWCVPNGARVAAGAAIAEIETSKAVVELAAEHDGYLVRAANESDQVAIGARIGVISTEPSTAPESAPPEAASSPSAPPQPHQFSRRAKALMDEHGLDPALFAGKALVREEDVRQVLSGRAQGSGPSTPRRGRAPIAETVPLSPLKRTEIRYLAEGHGNALASAVTVFVRPQALDAARAAAAASHRLTHLDFVAVAAARALRTYREFNAFLEAEAIHYYAEVNVGIAMNLDRGLLVPVIRQAADRSPQDVSRIIAEFAMRYLRGALSERDLTGGTFTITDLSAAGAARVLPLINREQSAVLGLGLDGDAPSPRLALTLAFDHRVADGQQASHFLCEIKEALEASEASVLAERAPRARPPVCRSCLLTADRLREEAIADYLISVVRADGAPEYLCVTCLVGLTDGIPGAWREA
ncbi:MAG: 2-oxo acid dehydrogenase subunit E2 [Chloroflexi bacterium]|nr:2-oxo acid dehydrogenase subunit E2 [Chloroflexota bacterium]